MRRWSWLWLVGPILLFTVLRLPALIHQPGMQDEQWFAVPGLTVWREGIPRIPYVPTRRRETLFENADVCLMALPPGLFYVQAPFFAILPPGHATARIPLFLGAWITIGLTFGITRRLGGSPMVAMCAAAIVAISRPLLFTGLTARPELLCAICGWLAIGVLWKHLADDHIRYSLLAGGLCGLGALFHPFALVFGMQTGLAVLGSSLAFGRRCIHLAVIFVGGVSILGLWFPLIASFPYEFQSQFFANVLDRAGPGLPVRLIWPLPAFMHHARLLWEFAGPLQSMLMAVALVVGSIGFWRMRRDRVAAGYLALVWTSVYLTAAVAGLHPTKGYWIYPFVWLVPLLCVVLEHWTKPRGAADGQGAGRPIRLAACMLLIFAMLLPGGGLRTTWLYLTNWKDPRYYGPAFIAGVLDDLPQEGLFFADLCYVFDIYLSGRQTRLCQERQQYWGDAELEYDYLVLSWEGEDAGWAEQYGGQHLRRVGQRELKQSLFVDLYRQAD
jgi:hypothetical protein